MNMIAIDEHRRRIASSMVRQFGSA